MFWRVIPGFPRYEISDEGYCRRVADGTLLDGGLSSQGYWKFKLTADDGTAKDMNAHELMAAAFYGPRPDGALTVHLNGDKLDDRLGNVRYQIADTALAQAAYQRILRHRKHV